MKKTAFFLAASAVFGQASAGPEKIQYPENFEKGVLYATVDRYDNKQYRELYASPEAIQAVKDGKPLPDGSVLTMVIYKAQVDDAQGSPIKDAKGRFMKGDLVNVAVMEKRAGWGSEYPEELRNGNWEYSIFNPDHKFNEKANIKACFECHKPHAKQDFVISLAKLGGTFPTAAAIAKTGPTDVNIQGFAFGPAKLSVAAGQPVTWTNADDSPHQVSIQGKPLKTGVLLRGQSESLKLDEPGTYYYICGLHPNMKGTIEVTK